MTNGKSRPSNFHHFLSRVISRIKKAPYVVDSAVPVSALCSLTCRRLAWLLRGTTKTLVLRGRLTSVFMGPGVSLCNASMIMFGKGVTIWRGVSIDGLSKDGIQLGDNVTIGEFSIIRATSVLSNVGVGCRIGSNSAIGAFSFVGAAGGVRIGNHVIMGQNVTFHSENHNYESLDRPIKDQGTTHRGILIEDDCWIGAKVTFLDGAHVGKGCVIGAGAVVTGYIPDYSVAVGVPARVVKNRRERQLQKSRDGISAG